MLKNYKAFLMLFFMIGWTSVMNMSSAFAQGGTITGTVSDENQVPLPGVTVKVKGTTVATATNSNGRFSISAAPGDILVLTFIGYLPKEITAVNKIVVFMAPNAKSLNDVVVIGYGTSTKQEVTGAVSSVKAEELNQGVLLTPAELLQGKVPGLDITHNGDPNQAPTVSLRGPSTLRTAGGTGNVTSSGSGNTTSATGFAGLSSPTDPFYVIDGVPGASVDLVAPADIESIDILRDASATAIYGNRAANGVIMITTKRSKPGETRLSYSGYGSINKVSKNLDMLSGPELRAFVTANGQTLTPSLNDDGSNTNWQKVVERTGYSQSHNVSFGRSTDNGEYGVSTNYFVNNGVIQGTSLNRTTLKGFINQRFFHDRLKLGLNLVNIVSNSKDVYQSYVLPNMVFYLPTVGVYNADGSFKEYYNRGGDGDLNPLSLIKNNIIAPKDTRTLTNGIIQVDILPGLKYTLTLSSQKEQYLYNTYRNSNSGLAQGLAGVAKRTSYLNSSSVIESYFNYDHFFGKHALHLLGGYSYEQDKINNGFGIQTQGFSNDNLTYNNLYLSNPQNLSQIAFDNNPIGIIRLISFYGRIQYSYDDKYLFSASLRNDGSSALGANVQYGYFPAISGAWRIIKENFMQNQNLFTDLKLRAGYGVTGNTLGFSPDVARTVYGTPPTGSKYQNGGVITNALGVTQNPNPDLKWESTGTTNVGLDFGLLQDRISGSVDVYSKITNNLIDNQLTVPTTQYFVSNYTANIGKISNKGIEGIVNFVPVKSRDFSWKTTVIFAHNTNKVVSLTGGQFKLDSILTTQVGGKGQSGNYSQIIKPGYALGTFLLWHYMGQNAAGVSTYLNAKGQVISTTPATTDARVGGNALPKLTYGWTNNFRYKNWDLSFLIRGVYGNKILNASLAAANDPTDATVQNIPKFTAQNETIKDVNAYLVSDRFLENGSYIRFDNGTLGFTLRPATAKLIKSIRFSVSTNNLFIITKYRGIDPELNSSGLAPGIDNNNYYPKTRTFQFGLNANF